MKSLVELLRDSTTDAEDALIQMQQTGNVEATKVVFTHLQRSCDELNALGHYKTAEEFLIKGRTLIANQENLEQSMLEMELARQEGGIEAAIAYVFHRLPGGIP